MSKRRAKEDRGKAKNFPVVTLIIALIGGVPGILQTYDYFFNAPRLNVLVRHIIVGQKQIEPEIASILMGVTLSNSNDKDIAPDIYDLYVKRDSKWIRLQKLQLDNEMNFIGKDLTFSFNDLSQNNLQGKDIHLKNGSVARGFLLYLTDGFTQKELLELARKKGFFKLVCIDAYSKKYEVILDVSKGDSPDKNSLRDLQAGYIDPSLGLKVHQRSERMDQKIIPDSPSVEV